MLGEHGPLMNAICPLQKSLNWERSILYDCLLSLFVANQSSAKLKKKCNLPKEVGPCKASLKRYFYNTSTKQCEEFYYGGCQGNENNFLTEADCLKACQSKLNLTEFNYRTRRIDEDVEEKEF